MHALLACGVSSLLGLACGIALWQEPGPRAAALPAAAREFLDALPPALRAKAEAPLSDPGREQWHYVPREYPGVSIGELDPGQTGKLHALLRAVLSAAGHGKVAAIIALEDVLRELEQARGQQADHRQPGRYWLRVYGTPSDRGAFAFCLQGHHVSLHFSVVDGRVAAATPAFLGANPHAIPSGPRQGERILGREEDLARALLVLCSDEQLREVVLATKAPADILLGPGRPADGIGAPQGLPYAAMTPLQQGLLWRLVEEYVRNRHDDEAGRELQRIDAAGRDRIRFAWLGSVHRGQGHYYRIHGPTFVIEYDNTQNDANHLHTVFRDLEHDFGGDLLRAHYEHDHKPGK
jgi:hypothetical protein